MFVICSFDKVFLSGVLYCWYRSVKRHMFDQDSQYRPGQLEKSKRSNEIFSFGRRDLCHEQFTRRDQAWFVGLVLGTGPRNSNKFEFVGLVAGWSLRLHFLTKMGTSHKGTWSSRLVTGTSPLCVPTLSSG